MPLDNAPAPPFENTVARCAVYAGFAEVLSRGIRLLYKWHACGAFAEILK